MLQEIYRLNLELTKQDESRKKFLREIEKELDCVQNSNPAILDILEKVRKQI